MSLAQEIRRWSAAKLKSQQPPDNEIPHTQEPSHAESACHFAKSTNRIRSLYDVLRNR